MDKSYKRKELNQSSLFSSTSKQGVASVSLTSSIFGIANDNRNEDNHDNNSDLFSNSKTFQEVSQRHQQKNRKRQRVQSSVPLLSTGANRETTLARRRQLTTATRDLVESITVDLSSYDNADDEQQQQQQVDDDIDNDDDLEKGILRLAVGRSSFVVRKQGVLILKSLFSNKDQSILKSLQSHSNRIQSKVCDQLDDTLGKDSYYSNSQKKKNDGKKDYSFRFQEVASRCLGRLDIRYGMNEPPFSNLHPPTSTAQTKKNSLFHSLLWPLIQDLLGKDAELVYTGLIPSFPNSEDQPWHQDGCTLFPEAPPELGDSLPPYALNVFLPLLDITEELGPTEFWLASHCSNEARDSFLSSNGGGAATTLNHNPIGKKNKNIVAPLIQTGDALIYDYRVCHRGTSNLSPNITRPMLYLMYARPWFKEHLNFGTERLFD